MGILLGAENIPSEWSEPIGDGILTMAISRFGLPVPAPKTVSELTQRTMLLRQQIERDFPHEINSDLKSRTVAQKLWQRSPYELQFDISYATIGVEYLEGPWIEPGKCCPIKLWVYSPIPSMPELRFRWRLPEGWRSKQPEVAISGARFRKKGIESDVIAPADIPERMSYVTLEVSTNDRSYPTLLNIPFRRKGAVLYPKFTNDDADRNKQQLLEMVVKRVKQC